MLLAILLIFLLLWVMAFLNKDNINKETYDYKCFLLTIPSAKERSDRFLTSHNKDIPIEVIHGPDTRNLKVREIRRRYRIRYFETLSNAL